ncbi:hypothetical protein D3C81_700810 [compost metagenome]
MRAKNRGALNLNGCDLNRGAQGDGALRGEAFVVGKVLQCSLQQIIATMAKQVAQACPMPRAFYPQQLGATKWRGAALFGKGCEQ